MLPKAVAATQGSRLEFELLEAIKMANAGKKEVGEWILVELADNAKPAEVFEGFESEGRKGNEVRAELEPDGGDERRVFSGMLEKVGEEIV